MDDKEKQIAKLFAKELLPLFVGLRNELKSLGEKLATLNLKELPDKYKTEILNWPLVDGVQEVKVVNLIKEIEITNPVKEVSVKDFEKPFNIIENRMGQMSNKIQEVLHNVADRIVANIKNLPDQEFKVNVQNQKEIKFPDIQKVEIQNHQKQIEAVRITNSQPSEAIPVKLTSKDGKRFYEALQQIIGLGSDVDLSGIKKALAQFKFSGDLLKVEAALTITPFDNLWQRETFNGKGFSVITPDITISNTIENDFFLLKNPTSSGKLVRFNRFIMNVSKGTAEARGTFRVYRAPTITTDGTSVSIFKIRSTQSASSVCSAFHSPTISGRGTLVNKFNMITNNFAERFQDLGRFLEENNNLLITFEPQNSGVVVNFMAEFIEV